MRTSSASFTEVVFETLSSCSGSGSGIEHPINFKNLGLLMSSFDIKATINPASIGSSIASVTKDTENYSVILSPSVLSYMRFVLKGLKGCVSHGVFIVLSIPGTLTPAILPPACSLLRKSCQNDGA